jgi:hypothetical protein
MSQNNGIYTYMDCSTVHITEEADMWLFNHPYEQSALRFLLVNSTDAGYLIYIPNEPEHLKFTMKHKDLPKSVKRIMKKAQKLGCRYVKLDRDGLEHDDLKQYEW